MHGMYSPYLMALSLLVAVLASYTTLELSARIRRLEGVGSKRTLWLAGGAIAIGSGMGSVHFIAILARQMPIKSSYDPWITALSFLIAVIAAYPSLQWMTRSEPDRRRAVSGSALMAMGLVAMQYCGLSAIRTEPAIRYRLLPFLAAVLIAFTVSGGSIWVAFKLREDDVRFALPQRCASAFVLGLAIAGMHYVGISAVIVPAGTAWRAGGTSTNVLVVMVALLSIGGLVLALIISKLDSRFDQFTMLSVVSRRGVEVDSVTGMTSRSAFLEQTDLRMAATRTSGTTLGILFLDLDGFKSINDTLGFAAGDELLKAFSDDLLKRVRFGTLVARLSGDEFVVLLDGMRDSQVLGSIAKSIFDRLRKNFRVDHMPLHITASAGVAIYPQDGDSVATLLKNASIAMYSAKRHGKNSFRFFDSAMSHAASKILQINRDIGEAIEKNQFSMVYQPKFDAQTNRLTGAEALIRWFHPVLGNIPPLNFIPVAEETGQIVQISEWVITEVCRQLKIWERQGLSFLKVSINLSPEQLRQDQYAERIARMVAEAGVAPTSILFEITETAAMREPKQAGEMIHEFQQAGFDFSVDDFGTGYSSMAYLQRFRVKELKIDRFFINSLEAGGEEEHTIVAAIIALAHALHMTVVAEGVETIYQFAKLKEMNCDEVQGYLLGRPMLPSKLEELLREELLCRNPAASPQFEQGAPSSLQSAMA